MNFDFPTSIQETQCKEILDKATRDRVKAGKAKGEEDESSGRSLIFIKILALFRNVEQHYNTPLEDETPVDLKLEMDQIAEMTDAMFGSFFGSACSLLRHALGNAWFQENLYQGFDYMDMLLSEHPF